MIFDLYHITTLLIDHISHSKHTILKTFTPNKKESE